MANNLLVKYDNEKFGWRKLPSGEGSLRRLGGGELAQDVFNRFHKGYQTLFFGAYLDVVTPTSEARLIAAARDAWLWLRFHLPTIATRIEIKDDGTSHLVYETGNVDGWAERTFIVSPRQSLDLDSLRSELGRNKVPSEEGDQTWAHLIIPSLDQPRTVPKFAFLLHTHHSPFDGNGLKIVVNRYLTQLALNLGADDDHRGFLNWGQEISNLAPPVFEVLSPSVPRPIEPETLEEPTFEHPYYASLGAFFQGLSESMFNPYGFVPRQADRDWPSPEREEIIFTTEESAQIISALKPTRPADTVGFTVTHLAHAALAMTVIADNPPPSEAQAQFLNNLSLRNCRGFLVEPYSSPREYPGYALGVGVFRIPVSLFFSDDGKLLPLDKETLVKIARAVRDLYRAQQALPDPINYMGLGAEIFCANFITAAKANMLPAENGYAFSSDGISEKFLDHAFVDASGGSVFELSKHFLSLNRVDPAPFFRVSSWRGKIELGADFNANVISADEVGVYMRNWKKFMLMGIDFDDDDF